MKTMVRAIARFLGDESGPTAVEYAMLMLLIFLAVLTIVTVLGQSTAASFQGSADSLQSAFGGA